MRSTITSSLGILVTTACTTGCVASTRDSEPVELGGSTQAIVVGADDRRDVYEHPDADLRALAAGSTVALMNRSLLDESDPDDVTIAAYTPENLCLGERFRGQEPAAFCSGTLIADDLVLTAGHCITAASCADVAFVFNFRQESAGERAQLTSDDVYHCAEVLVRRDHGDDSIDPHDHAIVRLDRAATPAHTSANVVTSVRALPLDTPLTLIGHPEGLPTKIADGGRVVAQFPNWSALGTTLDSSAGNSGSGVFDAEGQLVALLTHGICDTFYQDGSCKRWATAPEGGDHAGVRYVFFPIRELCSKVDHALCGSSLPVCGDALCEPREDHESCAVDCPELPAFYDPNASSVSATLTMQTSWTTGYCAQVAVHNGGTSAVSWEVELDLQGGTLTSLWDGRHVQAGGRVVVGPTSWQPVLSAGVSTSFGFCASRSHASAVPVVVAAR